MTDQQLQSLGRYALYAVAGALVAAGLKLGQELAGSNPIEWRAVASVLILSLCGTLSTAVGATTLVRPGSEGVASQVDALRDQGVHRDDMVVVPRDQAVVAIAEDGSVQGAFTSAQLAQVLDGLETRMKAEPAAQDDPLPPSPRYPGHG